MADTKTGKQTHDIQSESENSTEKNKLSKGMGCGDGQRRLLKR